MGFAREWECLLKDFLPRPKVFTFRFAYDLHIICVWLQSLSVVQIMFKLELISRMSFFPHLSLPPSTQTHGRNVRTFRGQGETLGHMLSVSAMLHIITSFIVIERLGQQQKPGQGCPEG